MKAREFLQGLSEAKGAFAVFMHNSPDPDALCSAFAVKELLTSVNPDAAAYVVKPPSVGPQVKALMKNYSLEFDSSLDELREARNIVVVDTSSSELTSYARTYFESFKGQAFVIDHHSGEGDLKLEKQSAFLDKDSISTSQMVYRLFKEAKAKPSKDAASLLLSGIITDSAFFTVSTPETFRLFADLLEESGKSYVEVTAALKTDKELSERIAKLKAARRARIYSAGDFLLATTDVGSFEASAANGLISLGADAGFVYSKEKTACVISSRASNSFISRTGIHLGNLLSEVASNLNGTGGGHAGAAAMNFSNVGGEEALKACLSGVVEHLKSKGLVKSAELKEYK